MTLHKPRWIVAFRSSLCLLRYRLSRSDNRTPSGIPVPHEILMDLNTAEHGTILLVFPLANELGLATAQTR